MAQEDSHLPPGPEHIGSLTGVVHELTVRLARRYLVVLAAIRYPGDAREERANDLRYLRFRRGADTAVLASLFRWRNRIGRLLGMEEKPYPDVAGWRSNPRVADAVSRALRGLLRALTDGGRCGILRPRFRGVS